MIVCPVAVEPDDPQSYYSVAERLVAETPGAFRPNQYGNEWNPWAHEQTTGPEIWRQTAGRITTSWPASARAAPSPASAATSRPRTRRCRSWAPTPPARCTRAVGRPYLVEGIGEDFWPTTYDPSLVDRVVPITDEDSFLMARRVTRRGCSSAGRAAPRWRPPSRSGATSGPTTWWWC